MAGSQEGSTAQGNVLSDRVFFAASCALFLVVSLAMAGLAGAFSGSVWMLGDTGRFFEMAGVIARGSTPYVDYQDPKPPLIFFLLTLPTLLGAQMAGSLLLVAAFDCLSAVIAMKIAWRLYGRGAGLLGGLLLAVNLAWAEGYFVLTEPFALTFILLSTYLLMSGRRNNFILAGVSAGLAIGFKQYALLLLPLSLYYMYRKGERKNFVPYMAGVLAPLLIVFAAVFLVYGAQAGFASLYWSFGMAPDYISGGSVQDLSTYRIEDPVIAAAWVLLALSLFAPLIAFAAACLIKRQTGPEEELFLLAGLAFAATLIIRPFLHYWALAIPFATLLVAGAFGVRNGRARLLPSWLRVGDKAFFAASSITYAVLFLASTAVADVLMEGRWRPPAIQELYGLADIVLKATAPYIGQFPEPAAIQIYFSLPHRLGVETLAGLIVTGSVGFLCALTATAIAWRLYGRTAALLAGAIFAVSVVWALGYMLPADIYAVLFLLLSLYLLCLDVRDKYLASGICAGAMIAIKPFAAVLVPVTAIYLYRDGKRSAIIPYALGALAPALVLVAAVAAGYPAGGVECLFELPSATSPAALYDVPDALLAMTNTAAAGAFITVTVPIAVAAFFRSKSTLLEKYLLTGTVVLLYTLLFKAFAHYWFMALPFAAVLCARLLHREGAEAAMVEDEAGAKGRREPSPPRKRKKKRKR